MKTIADILLPMTTHSQTYSYVQSDNGNMNFIRLDNGSAAVVFSSSALLAYLQVRRDEIEPVINFLTVIRQDDNLELFKPI